MEERLELLFSPLRIGRLTLKNRVVMPPMNTNFSDENGAVTSQVIEYFARRAKGGAGLIVVDATSIAPEVKKHGLQPMLYDERFVPGYAKLVEKIHRYGAKASIEIIHYGSETTYPAGPKVSASNVTGLGGVEVHPLTREEISEIEDQFVYTAYLAKLAGFDAVTFHGTHGYLIAQFLSPLYNKRQDEYGGKLENRLRFLQEIIEKTKQKLGDEYPIMVRISTDEYMEGGRTIDETVAMAKALERMGVAAIDLSCAVPNSYFFSIAPGTLPGMKGLQRENAKAIKAEINIPVIVAGGIRDPYIAEEFLEAGVADLIALGRAQIADPDFVNKSIAGRTEEIRPCLSCLTCFYSLREKHCLHCAVNPEAGREYELQVPPERADGKRLVVIGGGPAGMEAARTAAKRGYQVTLFEKKCRLGGALYPASMPAGKEDMRKLIAWYEGEMERNLITVMRDAYYTGELDQVIKPDVLINATGADFSRTISGSDLPNVLTAIEALTYPELVGERVVVIGGGNTGCETAEFFSDGAREVRIKRVRNFAGELEYDLLPIANGKSRQVTIVEFFPTVGNQLGGMHKPIMDLKLATGGVRIMTSTKVMQIYEDGRIDVEGVVSGEKEVLCADTIILAGGMSSAAGVWDTEAEQVFSIGDCRAIGKIDSATYDGYFTAREI